MKPLPKPDTVCFTGTRKGLTEKQRIAVADILGNLDSHELHHGDCVGADEEVHGMALTMGYEIYVHPPTEVSHRAFCKGATITFPVQPYLIRNHEMVDEAFVVVAASHQQKEVLRSGTWATVRYAMKKHRQVIIAFPDGQVEARKG